MIYCVEDEQKKRKIEVYTLQSVGLEAKGCASGKELYAELEKELPKLILLDIMLPDEDGLNVVRRLRSDERYANIPVIMARPRVRSSTRSRAWIVVRMIISLSHLACWKWWLALRLYCAVVRGAASKRLLRLLEGMS